MLKKKWFWAIIIVILAIVVLIVIFKPQPEAEYVTTAAAKRSLQQTVEVTGSVESADDIDLNFKSTGIIQSIDVEVGDQVQAGHILANLRSSNISAQITDAQAAVMVAESDLEALLAGQSTEDIQVIEEEVIAAEQVMNKNMNEMKNLTFNLDVFLRQCETQLAEEAASKAFMTGMLTLGIF